MKTGVCRDFFVKFVTALTLTFAPVYYAMVPPEGRLVFNVFCFILFVFTLISASKKGKIIIGDKNILIAVFVFLLAVMINAYRGYGINGKVAFINFFLPISFFYILINNYGKKDVPFLMDIMILVVFGISLIGIAALFSGSESIIFVVKKYYRNRLTATYINPNHFALLINLVCPFSVLMLVKRGGLWRIFYSVVALVFIVSIFLTKSMAGIIAFFFWSIAMAGLTGSLKDKRAVTIRIVFYVAMFLLMLFFLSFFFNPADKLYSIEMRLVRWKLAFDILKNSNIFEIFLGHGGGMYSFLYWPYCSGIFMNIFSYVHNDYLQVLVEYGLVGLAGLLFMVLYPLYLILKLWRRDMVSAAFGASFIGFFIQLFFDFNLFIPANFLYFVTIAAVFLIAVKDTLWVVEVKDKVKFISLPMFFLLFLYVSYVNAEVSLGEIFDRGGSFFAKRNNYELADKILKAGSRISKDDGSLLISWSDIAISRGLTEKNLMEGLDILNEALQINPENIYALVRKGDIYLYMNDIDRAIESYDKAIGLAPFLLPVRLKKMQAGLNSKDSNAYVKEFLNWFFANYGFYTFSNDAERETFVRYLSRIISKENSKKENISERLRRLLSVNSLEEE